MAGETEHVAIERLIEAEQDERRRLALFLHDGPVQRLSGIALMLDGALHSIADGHTEQAQAIIESALAQHRATIRELRDLSFVLEPVVLRDHGFGPALQALADQTQDTHAVLIDVDVAVESPGSLGSAASVALYTILRELVDQAVRRGPPTRMRIAVHPTREGSIVASVSDDAEPERRRRSLEAIVERARQLHGTVEVVADGGTEIRVTLPPHTAHR